MNVNDINLVFKWLWDLDWKPSSMGGYGVTSPGLRVIMFLERGYGARRIMVSIPQEGPMRSDYRPWVDILDLDRDHVNSSTTHQMRNLFDHIQQRNTCLMCQHFVEMRLQ